MSKPSAVDAEQMDLAALHSALAVIVRDRFGAARRIVALQRAPSVYRSSFALEEVTVTLDNGLTFGLLRKDLSWQALSVAGQQAKPTFLYDPQREIATYRQILAAHLPDAPRCYGAVVDVAQAQYWLFLEKVTGAPLVEADLSTWQAVARWLATMHSHFARQADLHDLAAASRLLRYDRAFYWQWPHRAQRFLRQRQPALPAAQLAQFDRLVAGYDTVVDGLLSLPVTLLHGEFYAANVLVQASSDRLRVCPVDWEMAALGPGPIDLAALVAGAWSETEKQTLAGAYYAGLTLADDDPFTLAALLATLDYCRLHVACQWLGWSADWTAPTHQAQDWLAEAVGVAARIGLIDSNQA